MYIVQIAAELAQVAKVGGLGDVVYGLSKELIRLGHHVEILLPKYSSIQTSSLQDLKIEIPSLKTPLGEIALWSAKLENLDLKLIDSPHAFTGSKIYGHPNDLDRFLLLSQAAIAYLLHIKNKPHVIHMHDWHTALIPALQKNHGTLKTIRSVLTLHNLEYQGECDPAQLSQLQLENIPSEPSFLKMGILYAEALTTVSPTYEKEIQTPLGGFGLDTLLAAHAHKLTGILNGIDPTFWNPKTDSFLSKAYSLNSIHDILEGKAENRLFLQKHLGLAHDKKPLVISITRLVAQKGPQLIKHALFKTLEQGGQFVLLGASGPQDILNEFQELQTQLSNNPNASINIDQNEELAHLIFASADLIVIPSFFEPCGLTQLISMRYGTVPLARKTGGLADTVFDSDTSDHPLSKRNGFTFDFPDTAGVDWALNRAFHTYHNDADHWKTLIKNGVSLDFSWKESVHRYLKVYRGAS
jgi:starch synthase